MNEPKGAKRIDWIDTLELDEWIKLPLAVMRDVGPAVQTLGGLLKMTKDRTFARTSIIADKAWVPLATARKHLRTLDEHGWVNNGGRETASRGQRKRRTATVSLTKQTLDQLEPYGMLPWFATTTTAKLSWSALAVLSVVVARFCSLKAVIDRDEHGGLPETVEEYAAEFDELGGDERFGFSLARLGGETGLGRAAIIKAKRLLAKRGIINWYRFEQRLAARTGKSVAKAIQTISTVADICGGTRPGEAPDLLVPNWKFYVITRPASPGKCYVDFHTK